MRPVPENRRWRWAGGYLLFACVVSVALAPAYFLVEASYRAGVVRAGAGLMLAVALFQLRGAARRRYAAQPRSAFEEARNRPPEAPSLAPLFLKLRDEVRFSAENQRYFEHTLWPRLQRLSARLGRPAHGVAPPIPAGRRWFRRGPSLATLSALVSRIEEES